MSAGAKRALPALCAFLLLAGAASSGAGQCLVLLHFTA